MADWPHAPVHRLGKRGAYIVTCGTYLRKHVLHTEERLTLVRDALFRLAEKYAWRLQAWAVMSNHYHFVAISPEEPESLKTLISTLHVDTATELNKLDGVTGRRVWYNFFDTHVTYQRSYLARLNYVHQNPVHHGVAKVAANYRWCSAAWFEQSASNTFRRTVESFNIDRVNVYDDF